MNDYKKIIATIAIVLLPGLLMSLLAQKSVELKYDVDAGDKYEYKLEIDQDIVFDAGGQTMALDQLMNFRMTSNIDEKMGSEYKISTTVDAIKMTQSIFGMQITYDSEDPNSMQNPMAAKIGEEMNNIIGSDYSMTMDERGHVTEVDASDLSNDEIINNISSGSNFAIYKEGSVSVGESWEGDVEPLENSDMKVQMRYTLLKVSGKEATLGLNGTISSNKIDDQEMKMNGTMTGEMRVDVNTGWLIESVLNQEIELDIE
ncbi:MAG: DUF6263 family protein, partial [Bacteroidales bacterium]|nr:DUF6263 family protein [Bacteroidales bacterium]